MLCFHRLHCPGLRSGLNIYSSEEVASSVKILDFPQCLCGECNHRETYGLLRSQTGLLSKHLECNNYCRNTMWQHVWQMVQVCASLCVCVCFLHECVSVWRRKRAKGRDQAKDKGRNALSKGTCLNGKQKGTTSPTALVSFASRCTKSVSCLLWDNRIIP